MPQRHIWRPRIGIILLHLQIGRSEAAKLQVVEQQWSVRERQQRLVVKEACRPQARGSRSSRMIVYIIVHILMVLQTGLAPDRMHCCVQDERQKQQDEEWQEMKRQREEDLDAKEAADRALEERKGQQGEQLAAVKAKLDALKAQKQDMVEKLKQVPPHATLSGLNNCIPGQMTSKVYIKLQHAQHLVNRPCSAVK